MNTNLKLQSLSTKEFAEIVRRHETRRISEMMTVFDVPIQALTTEDFEEIMRQHDVPVLSRNAGGPLRQFRVIDPKPISAKDLSLHSRA